MAHRHSIRRYQRSIGEKKEKSSQIDDTLKVENPRVVPNIPNVKGIKH